MDHFSLVWPLLFPVSSLQMKHWLGKDFEGDSCDVFGSTVLTFALTERRKPRKTLVRIAKI